MKDSPSNPKSIHSNEVIIEVIDDNTGITYRRRLPLEYKENANGIRLDGEDINGNPCAIVFFSEVSFEKIKDITGRGPDASVCDDHE